MATGSVICVTLRRVAPDRHFAAPGALAMLDRDDALCQADTKALELDTSATFCGRWSSCYSGFVPPQTKRLLDRNIGARKRCDRAAQVRFCEHLLALGLQIVAT